MKPVQADRGGHQQSPPNPGVVHVGELDEDPQHRVAGLGLTAHPGRLGAAVRRQLGAVLREMDSAQGGEGLQDPSDVVVVGGAQMPQTQWPSDRDSVTPVMIALLL